MIKVIIIAVLAFAYYWVKQRKSLEKKTGEKYSFLRLFNEKDDEIFMSVLAMVMILISLPELVGAVRYWFDIPEGIGFEIIRLFIGFFAGIAGTFVVDKATMMGKRKFTKKINSK